MQNKRKMMLKKLIIVLLAILISYLAVVYYFYSHQKELLYHPQARTQDEISSFAKDKKLLIMKYKSYDGESLQALYKAPEEGVPIIMLFNGNAAKIERAYSTLEQFIAKGYGGFINIYRGYGANPGVPDDESFFRDAEIIYAALKKLNPKSEVIFYGYSLGSGTATYMASKFDNKALILEGAFSSIADVAKDRYPLLPVNLLLEDKYMNSEYIKSVKSDILLMHGEDDSIVKPKFAQKLADANPRAKLVTYEAGDHRNLKCLDAYKDAIKWLDQI